MNTWQTDRQLPIEITSDIKVKTIWVEFEKTNCKFLKVKCNYQRGTNSGVFVFADEIVVE
jgi:hypothetical protein